MKATVIVGANYGDEGKGLATDYFTYLYKIQGKSVLNVLHNGGAQRAHTVELPNGVRHVFHHAGSGSLAGADTYLTGEFIINPIELKMELESLEELKCSPKIYVDDVLRITTPFDMIANQVMEENRSYEEKLGTCGMGIWETCVRNEKIRFTVQDLFIAMNSKEGFIDSVRNLLIRIRDYYIKWRLPENHCFMPPEWAEIFYHENLIENYIQDCYWMLMDKRMYYTPSLFMNTPQVIWKPYLKYDHVIFENGQGLLLDTNLTEDMEYNTPSNTTLLNPASLISKWYLRDYTPIETCNIVYVTRTYITRHGKGVLFKESDVSYLEKNKRIFDKTNVPNQWQGELRYAKMVDMWITDNIFESIVGRIRHYHNQNIWTKNSVKEYRCYLFVTHADELPPNGAVHMLIPSKKEGHNPVCTSGCYISYGPQRKDVKYYKTWEDIE